MSRNKISQEKRELIIRWYNDGKSTPEIMILLPEIPRSTINSIIKKYCNTGMITASPRGGPRFTVVTPILKEKIEIIVSEDCTKTLDQIKQQLLNRFGITASSSSIFRALKNLTFTFKRLVMSPIARNTPEVIEKRYEYALNFLQLQNNFLDSEFVFIDEVGFSLTTRRTKGRSLIGSDAIRRVTRIRSRNLSVCVGMNVAGEYFKEISNSPYNSEKFCEFLQRFIVHLSTKNITRGIFILDNVSFHHSSNVSSILSGTGFSLMFLPPYSPFLNPIENSFSKWKILVASMHADSENELVNNILMASGLFVLSDFQGYWRNMVRYIVRALLREEIDS